MEICGCVGRFMKSKLHNGIIQWEFKKIGKNDLKTTLIELNKYSVNLGFMFVI